MAPKNLIFAMLVAMAAYPGALLLASLGQAIGALVGGCTWIGLSTPMDRQVWALVNQPSLHFSSLTRAAGYWAGSSLLPLMVALGAIPLLPRARRLGSEIAILHAAWAATLVGLAWLPLLDRSDGHLARWFELWRLPGALVYLVPILALPAAVLPVLRLLSLLRMVRQDCGRGLRLATVSCHLLLPALIWFGGATLIRGAPAVWSTVAVAATILVALGVAWKGYPQAFVYRLEGLAAGSWIRATIAAGLIMILVLAAGWPLGSGQRIGVLWARPGATNNIRPWIDAVTLPSVGEDSDPTEASSKFSNGSV